ncbi:MAG: hypothetical protein ACKPE1_27260, partial [Dolichospermum sp.]
GNYQFAAVSDGTNVDIDTRQDLIPTVGISRHFAGNLLRLGASLKAVYNLGKAKGYSFVGSNSVGNNAFFVRSDLKPSNIRELTLEEGYVASQFRESRDQEGNLSYLSW